MASAQVQLQEAQSLIKAGRYVEARELLVHVDHPKASEWLMKLEKRLSQKPKRDSSSIERTDDQVARAIPVAQSATPTPTTQVIVNQNNNAGWIVQGLWFLFVGWWMGAIWVSLAWVVMTTIIGIPLAIWMINRISGVMALRSPSEQTTITVSGYNTTVEVNAQSTQLNFFIRAVYFALVGWWLSGIWMSIAYTFCLLVIGMPVGFWMFDKTPSVLTLQR